MSLLEFARSLVQERRAITHLSGGTADNVVYTDGQGILDDGHLGLRRVSGIPAVNQALQIISGDLAKMPAMAYEVTSDGRTADRLHPILDLIGLWGRPHPDTNDTTFDLLFDWFYHCLLYGCAGLWIERDGPDPIGLLPLLPDRTRPYSQNGRKYIITEVNKKLVPIPDDDVLYLEGLNLDGLNPEHPIRQFRSTFEQAINAQDFTSEYFHSGTQQGGILTAPPAASKEAIKNMENQIVARRDDRTKWFRTLILKDGFNWTSTTSSLKDSTAVEVDESTARQVARIYNLPPSKLGLKDTVSYNSLDQDNRQYLDSCLSSWLIQARSQFHRKLILPSDQKRIHIDYEIDALQWADPETKAKIGMLGRQWGFLDVNTVRAWFNEKPLGEDALRELQSSPSGSGDAKELSVFEAAQKLYLSVGIIFTTAEARAIMRKQFGLELSEDFDFGGSDA